MAFRHTSFSTFDSIVYTAPIVLENDTIVSSKTLHTIFRDVFFT